MTTSRVGDAKTTRARSVADAHLGQARTVDGKPGAFDGDAAAFNRAERMNGGDAAEDIGRRV